MTDGDLGELALCEERAERAALDAIPALRARMEQERPGEEPWEALMDAALTRGIAARGLDALKPWLERVQARAEDDVLGAALPDALTSAPHALGWAHQAYGMREHLESFAAHTSDDADHASSLIGTRVYTPRFIADWIVTGCLALWRADVLPTVHDPAAGGGQLLLSALDALAARWPKASACALAQALSGVDLDPRAVWIAQRALMMRLAELREVDVEAVWAIVQRRVRVADGLDDAPVCDLVICNPPYMSARAMPSALRARLQPWAPFHTDLYVAFMRHCHTLARCAVGLLTPQTVWFLSKFARAREALHALSALRQVLHVGAGAFGALDGEKSTVMATVHEVGARGDEALCVDLRPWRKAADKRVALTRADAPVTRCALDALAQLPGAPLAYWLPSALARAFRGAITLGEVARVPGAQNKTGDNKRFVRRWDEVEPATIQHAPELWEGAPQGRARWVFYSKGGRFAPWWGNWTHVVDWSEQARAAYATGRTSNLLAPSDWSREGLCYTDFGGQRFNARWMPPGCVFDMAGPAIFVDDDDAHAREVWLGALLAVLNSSAARQLLNALNPSLHYQVRDVRHLPLPPWDAPTRALLAADALALVAHTRALHRLSPDDPLCDPTFRPSVEEARAMIEGLDARARALDAKVCALYQVAPEQAQVAHHMTAAWTRQAALRRIAPPPGR